MIHFEDIIGHEDTKKALAQAIAHNHLAHALLFRGAEGGIHYSLALALLGMIYCPNKDDNMRACGQCPTCQKITKRIHPDIHFIFPVCTTKKISKASDAISASFMAEFRNFLAENPYPTKNDWANHIGAENKQVRISKEEANEIIKTVSLTPFEAPYKTICIWLPELMHSAAANTILKILEEPPAKTYFLLISDSPEDLLTTIISRTQAVFVPKYSQEEIVQILTIKHQVDPKKANFIAPLCDANPNKALQLLNDVGQDYSVLAQNWLRSAFMHNKPEFLQQLLEISEQFSKLNKETQKLFFSYVLNTIRQASLYSSGAFELLALSPEDNTFIEKFARFIHSQNAWELTEKISEASYHIERNASARILFLGLSFEIADLLYKQSLSDLMS